MSAAGSRLIVNADDFGLSEAINDGIVEAHRNGIVTCASLIVNAPAFAHAVAAAKANPGLDLGVHLTLTELGPLCAPQAVPTLLGADGRFATHALAFAARYLRGAVRMDEVRQELDAQIRRALAAGLAISHLDSHQHVHVLPGIARIVAELAGVHGIRAVRYPRERLQVYMLERGVRQLRRLTEQAGLNLACAFSPLRRLRHPDRFVGFHCGGRLSEGRLAAVLHHLPGRGTFELMCHPAQAESGGPQAQWGYDGAAERAALTSARIREVLRERRIALVGYRDL